MKCLFLSAKRYSINNSLIRGFNDNGWSISVVDYEDFFPNAVNRYMTKSAFLPNRIRSVWTEPYLSRINRRYLDIFRETDPDLVLIYNNQLINPSALKEMKGSAAVAFFLGDNPLYSPTSIYNTELLRYADYIIAPDSFWREQLEKMGIGNIVVDFLGFDDSVYYPFTPSANQLKLYGSDFIYIGHAHRSGWGYKRFLFLNHFAAFDLRAYMAGSGYSDYFSHLFPELADRVVAPARNELYSQQFNNLIYNCSKIGPVELVPSYFNGIHPRTFDLLGSGVVPLCEASADLIELFKGIDVPFIYDYGEIQEKASFLLQNSTLRAGLATSMRERVIGRHHPSLVAGRLIDTVFKR